MVDIRNTKNTISDLVEEIIHCSNLSSDRVVLTMAYICSPCTIFVNSRVYPDESGPNTL